MKIAQYTIGEGNPCFICAEIGINHNGDIDIAKELITAAKDAGCDAVKFQKRTPDVCVPEEQKRVLRETPWGIMTYLEYRYRIEFGKDEYDVIDAFCKDLDILWFASCWDPQSVDFMQQYDVPCYKIPSASLTDDALLAHHRTTGKPMVVSTGMSTIEQIDHAVEILGKDNLVLLHCNSVYPAAIEELNLGVINTLKDRYGVPVGYSGHEVGLSPSFAAAVMGACFIERHITLDRAMWGTDQSASVEPQGLARLVRDIRCYETAKGDGIKRVYDSERKVMQKLRKK